VEVETFGVDEATIAAVGSVPGVVAVATEDRGQSQVLIVQCAPGADVTQPVLAQLDGYRVGRVATREPTLEDAYIELVGEP
jgi:ABC-2 type transport system ATP-binding protein